MNNINNYYNYTIFNNTIFDNIIIIIIIVYIIKHYYQYKIGKIDNFNWRIFLIIPIILLFYYIIRMLFIFKTNEGKQFRTNECLVKGYNLLLNKINLPIEIIKPHLLNKPFNEFIISTSHNTFIPCLQNGDITSVDAIKNALILGARVIELDVFAKNNTSILNDDYTPVVVHGIESPWNEFAISTLDKVRKGFAAFPGGNILSGQLNKIGFSSDIFTTSYIYFEDCIKVISEFAKQTSDPIWIDLEINTNKLIQTQQKMKDILLKYFGNKLINNKKHFSQEPIKNLLNKIIITSSKSKCNITNELSNLINSYAGDEFYKNTHNKDQILNQINSDGIIHRIYPSGDIQGHLSNNFDPEPFWKNKYQLVALNFQNSDENLIKNITMFKNCSFVHFSEFL